MYKIVLAKALKEDIDKTQAIAAKRPFPKAMHLPTLWPVYRTIRLVKG
jgi:hypothetical protein